MDGTERLELRRAVERGDEAAVEQLLEAGVPPDGPGEPLRRAARLGHERIVELLVEHGAEIDRRASIADRTALIEAAGHGHLDVVKTLVGAGASVEAQVDLGGNAADYASRAGHAHVVEWLERHGSPDERSVTLTCHRGRARPGWRLFRRHTDVGNGEYSILLVHAPVDETATAIAAHLPHAAHHESVDRSSPMVRKRSRLIWVVGLSGQPWTIVVHGIGSLGWAFFDEGEELARHLAQRAGRVIHATENDTDCEERFVQHVGAGETTLHDAGLLRELGILLPGFDPWHEEGLLVFGVGSDGLERVDVIDVPWASD